MSESIYARLQQALPSIREWIAQFVADHRENGVQLSALAEPALLRCFPVEVLAGTTVVALPEVRFPPVGEFGLPEFAQMAEMPLAGITFDTTFFVKAGAQSQSLYFHETVHVVQWEHLGFDRFLLTYAANMIGREYVQNPLEAIAYSLQGEFEAGKLSGSPVDRIQTSASSAWSSVSEFFPS